MPSSVKRGFVDTPRGQIHYATAGKGAPVLLLHQTPRSWDEYREVLPIIGERYRAIAMDTIGFGDSYKPKERGTIETYAGGVMDFLDSMSIERVSLVGHHTGGVVAVEVAATYPKRVRRKPQHARSGQECPRSCACEGAYMAGWESPSGRSITGL